MADLNHIELILFDVDGVLTDGTIAYDGRGDQTMFFHVRDGYGIKWAMKLGLKIAILSGRSSRALNLRLTELGVSLALTGVHEKGQGFETICQKLRTDPRNVAYLGDDLIDLPAMLRCGYPMAVADAVEEVRQVARFVTAAHGGRGAVREAVEHILKTQGRWDELLEGYGV